MKTDLRNLLDKIYELEGLVYLAVKREEITDDLLRLISKKGHEVADLTLNLNKHEEISESPLEESSSQSVSFDDYLIEDTSDEPKEIVKPIGSQFKRDFNEDFEPHYKEERGKLVFSINERFRYRNELFDKSDIEFNNTLALVASMENYEEAEEYFINEQGFDISNPIVTEFLEVIKSYFK